MIVLGILYVLFTCRNSLPFDLIVSFEIMIAFNDMRDLSQNAAITPISKPSFRHANQACFLSAKISVPVSGVMGVDHRSLSFPKKKNSAVLFTIKRITIPDFSDHGQRLSKQRRANSLFNGETIVSARKCLEVPLVSASS